MTEIETATIATLTDKNHRIVGLHLYPCGV